VGLADGGVLVCDYFDDFPWDGEPPDATRLSAEAFLSALES
jgi:hypothetical protein